MLVFFGILKSPVPNVTLYYSLQGKRWNFSFQYGCPDKKNSPGMWRRMAAGNSWKFRNQNELYPIFCMLFVLSLLNVSFFWSMNRGSLLWWCLISDSPIYWGMITFCRDHCGIPMRTSESCVFVFGMCIREILFWCTKEDPKKSDLTNKECSSGP